MVWTMFAAITIAAVVLAGTDTRLAFDRLASTDFAARGQAEAVAEAGLVDAHAWFRRQTVQPVVTFAPRLDPAAVPPVSETDDPAVGLVREYEILPSLWGRYEVRPHVPAEAFTDTDGDGRYSSGEAFTDTDGNGRRDPDRETRDVSVERGLPSAGGAWHIVSHGYLYRRPRADLPLGVGPNVRVAAAHAVGEIRRLTILPPATAAICARTGAAVDVGSRARIIGGTKGGIIYASGTGSPTIGAGAEVSGSPATGNVPGYADAVKDVFGVTLTELRGMAEASYADALSVPKTVGEYTLTVIGSDIVFDGARPLRGTGIVLIEGDCTITSGSNSFFNGLLYVDGDLTLRAPAYIRGTIVVTGAVDVRGTGGDYVEMDYDPGMVVELLTLMGQYRRSTAIHRATTLRPDGTPDEIGQYRGIGGMGQGGGS
jgi:hypothetical protein